MSSLADLLTPPPDRPGCPIARLSLDDKDRAALDAAFTDDRFSASRIYEALKHAGHRVGTETVAKHKYGRCGCDRTG